MTTESPVPMNGAAALVTLTLVPNGTAAREMLQ
jgi:hypothetical protein